MKCKACSWIAPPLEPVKDGEECKGYKCNCPPLPNQPYDDKK
jgi:hypothetical protein